MESYTLQAFFCRTNKSNCYFSLLCQMLQDIETNSWTADQSKVLMTSHQKSMMFSLFGNMLPLQHVVT